MVFAHFTNTWQKYQPPGIYHWKRVSFSFKYKKLNSPIRSRTHHMGASDYTFQWDWYIHILSPKLEYVFHNPIHTACGFANWWAVARVPPHVTRHVARTKKGWRTVRCSWERASEFFFLCFSVSFLFVFWFFNTYKYRTLYTYIFILFIRTYINFLYIHKHLFILYIYIRIYIFIH